MFMSRLVCTPKSALLSRDLGCGRRGGYGRTPRRGVRSSVTAVPKKMVRSLGYGRNPVLAVWAKPMMLCDDVVCMVAHDAVAARYLS